MWPTKKRKRGYNLLKSKNQHVVPGLGMDCFLETNLFDLPHECAAHFVLWTVTIFYHLFSFPCRALGERNIFDPAILWREGGLEIQCGSCQWDKNQL